MRRLQRLGFFFCAAHLLAAGFAAIQNLNRIGVNYAVSCLSAPKPPSSFLFGGVTNTSLEITWTAPPDSDYDDFDVRWTPPDRGSVVNPYENRRSGSRIVRGMFPGRLYNFSLRTVSGSSQARDGAPPSYSLPIQRSIRTSRWRHAHILQK